MYRFKQTLSTTNVTINPFTHVGLRRTCITTNEYNYSDAWFRKTPRALIAMNRKYMRVSAVRLLKTKHVNAYVVHGAFMRMNKKGRDERCHMMRREKTVPQGTK